MKINYDEKGLVPAIIQDDQTNKVLMLGYMNQEALDETFESGLVTFFSRSKQRLWTKGETSGNTLKMISVESDCDSDSLLVKAIPAGPTCHTGADTCWDEANTTGDFLAELEETIDQRKTSGDEKSYVKSLFEKGTSKIAQKVGEEATEVVIESLQQNDTDFLNESADLLFHYLILLNDRGYRFKDVVGVLEDRKS